MKKAHIIRKGRIPRTKARVISFYGRTWESICTAYNALKSRYRKVVKLVTYKAMGAGLYRGYIEVA